MDQLVVELQQLLTHPEVFLVFAVVLLTVTANYFARKVLIHLEKQTERSNTMWDDALVKSARKPLAWLIWVLGISWAAEIIAAETDSTLAQMIEPVRFIAVVGLLAYFLSRFVTEAEKAFITGGADVTPYATARNRRSVWLDSEMPGVIRYDDASTWVNMCSSSLCNASMFPCLASRKA